MNREDLEAMEIEAQKELVKRRGLGGFDANAESIMYMTKWIYELIRHVRERTPRTSVKKSKK